jgi:predicted CxxxxCH...CXXCH cytochrome family protein
MKTTANGTSIVFRPFSGLHVNGVANVALSTYSTTGEPVLRGSYIGSACINAYCHGDGQTLTNPGNAKTSNFKWSNTPNGAGLNGCGTCHAYSSGLSTGSHGKHGNGCEFCHNATTQADVSLNILTYHADQNVSIKFNNANTAGTIIGLTADSNKVFSKPVSNTPSPARCANTYCHSNVQTGNGTGVFTSTDTPAWDQISSTNCISCHLTDSINHARHLGKPRRFPAGGLAINCIDCHGYNSPPNGLHSNLKINIALPAGMTYSRGVLITPGSGAYGSCFNAAAVNGCHNLRPNPGDQW